MMDHFLFGPDMTIICDLQNIIYSSLPISETASPYFARLADVYTSAPILAEKEAFIFDTCYEGQSKLKSIGYIGP